MNREANRRRHPGDYTLEWVWGAAAVVVLVLVVVMVWGAAAIGAALTGDPGPASNPLTYVILLAAGRAAWPGAATWVLAVLVVLAAAVAVAAGRRVWAWRASRSWADSRARWLSTRADTVLLRRAGAQRDAERLASDQAGPGSPLGRHGRDRAELWAPWEWVQLWIMGPRAGKTTCVCARQVIETRGPVVATSNKRDIVDLTRGPRSEQGRVWVFDPQDIVGEPPAWWWNPLSTVAGVADADDLARLIVAATRDADAKPDAYFDPEGQALLSGMLLAAALDGRPITAVYTWLTDANDIEASTILKAHGHTTPSNALYAVTELHPKQRDGIYGTARAMVSWLRDGRVLPWVTPQPGPAAGGPAASGAAGSQGDPRPHFDVADFVAHPQHQTMYLISREGRGTARALTAALAVAIVHAAEDLASHRPGGRLPTPMHVVLDEAANVVRWPDLPDLYSHFGSRGIVMSTFLQNWSQGAQVWGEAGMRKLWSAANVRVVGPGLGEERFLQEASHLIGDHDATHRSTNTGLGHRSVTTSLHREPVFTSADLAKLPPGRAVMLASGMPPTLLHLTHYSQTPYADRCAASVQWATAAITPAGGRPVALPADAPGDTTAEPAREQDDRSRR